MIKLMEMVKYRHIRPFTKVEMNQITDLIGQERFNYKEIYDGIKSVPPKKFTPPVVVEDKKGRLFVLDGDDKLTIFVALGSNLPVKKVNYSGEFNKETMGYYNKAFSNDLSSFAGSIGQGY
jgi:hypothetical protein